MCRSHFLQKAYWLASKKDFCFRTSCSYRSGQRMTVEYFVNTQSPIPFKRICQYSELRNIGNRKYTFKSTSTTSFCTGHCVMRVYGIIYYWAIFFHEDGWFWSCYCIVNDTVGNKTIRTLAIILAIFWIWSNNFAAECISVMSVFCATMSLNSLTAWRCGWDHFYARRLLRTLQIQRSISWSIILEMLELSVVITPTAWPS